MLYHLPCHLPSLNDTGHSQKTGMILMRCPCSLTFFYDTEPHRRMHNFDSKKFATCAMLHFSFPFWRL